MNRPAEKQARVIMQFKDGYKVAFDGGEALAEISGKYRHEASRLDELPAVGDYVLIRTNDGDSDRVIIEETLQRKSAFTRVAVGGADQVQVVAANIDVLFICMALNEDYNINRLERYVSVAWDSGAQPVIVLTKLDLCDDIASVLAEVSAVAFGIDILTTSNRDSATFEQLQSYIGNGVTGSFVGSSGVGKTTIVNQLLGYNALVTSEIRQDGKGRHTTTHRELFTLPNGGAIIDTPGMRELGIDSANLSQAFMDIEELAQQCRFSDCSHQSEPHCAVQQAVEQGALDARRLESFFKLRKELEYEGMTSKQIEEAKIRSMVGGFGEMKRARDYFKKGKRGNAS